MLIVVKLTWHMLFRAALPKTLKDLWNAGKLNVPYVLVDDHLLIPQPNHQSAKSETCKI